MVNVKYVREVRGKCFFEKEDFAKINLYFRFFMSILYTDKFLNFTQYHPRLLGVVCIV